jgi:hypothetical protein
MAIVLLELLFPQSVSVPIPASSNTLQLANNSSAAAFPFCYEQKNEINATNPHRIAIIYYAYWRSD